MPKSKASTKSPHATVGRRKKKESGLVTAARRFGSTLGTMASQAGDAADTLVTLSYATQKRTTSAALKARKRAKKIVNAQVASAKKKVKRGISRLAKAGKRAGLVS